MLLEPTKRLVGLPAKKGWNLQLALVQARFAASLDRLDRAEGHVAGDPRLEKIKKSLAILADDEANRAEKIQLLFSRPYDADWKSVLPKQSSRR